jgi:glycine oxidase
VAGTADVIVVGAGVIGCAVARELARRGARVRVFESRSVGAGATQASAGVLAPYIEARPGPLLTLAVRSLGMYDRFIEDLQAESGVTVEYRRCGTLEVAIDAVEADRLRTAGNAAHLTDAQAEWLDPAAARSLETTLPESVLGGLLIKAHAYVAATQMTEALTWAALRHGTEVEAGRLVAAIADRSRDVLVTAQDGERWSADTVVVATGSWSGQLAYEFAQIPAIKPIRGQLLRLMWDAERLGRVIWGPDCYIVPWSDGTVLVGATVEDVGFDERTTAAGVRDLLDAACDLLPAIWGATFLEARVGLRPASADGLPVIGRPAQSSRVVFATGHYRNGVLLAPLTASLVADLVLAGQNDPMLDAVNPGRFVST